MTQWQDEFPDFPATEMPAMPEGFLDNSWHNDVCPSFTNNALRLAIFVDRLAQDQRELDIPRFVIERTDDEGCIVGEMVLATDDWNDVVALVEKERSRQ